MRKHFSSLSGLRVVVTLALLATSHVYARTCRVIFFGAAEGAPQTAVLSDGKTLQTIELPTANFSPVYKLESGDVTLRLFAKTPPDLEHLPAGAPSATLAAAVEDCYLLVTSDPKNTVIPLHVQVINASSSAFKAGQMMWFNLSKFDVGGQLGKQNILVKQNSRIIIDSPSSGFESYSVKLGYSLGAGKPASALCSTTWQNDSRARSVIFIYTTPTASFPQIKGFVDSRAKEAKAAP